MSKKKAHKKNPEFKNDPFKTVKGFSVSAPQQATVGKTVVAAPPVECSVKQDHDIDFDHAMAQLGVESLAGNSAGANDDDDQAAAVDIDFMPEPKSMVQSDEDLFLESLGALERVFKDDYSDGDEAELTSAEPRRMKQLRQGKIRPQDRLDLHGCYRVEAQQRVRHFLHNSYTAGLTAVLIVTGKGIRSPNGEAVLRADIETYLSTKATAWVAEWSRAPRQYGGEGALVVFLRRTKG